ncbi:uncharacterized protein [Panulirus ornatus]|uniref:uncharacterized protein isoform X2 n=1 Tax=Panulirus ornatus TaxID=150431 RepID=UPI003A8872D4
MAVPSLADGNGTMVPPILLEDPEAASPTPISNETIRKYLKELELKEFYSTYDVWTGIRTAITLALFFVFTVTLILYKSKCKPRRKYELYPSLEDMPGRPLDYYDYWCSSPVSNDMGYKGEGVDALGRYYNNGRGETGSAPLPKRSVGSYSSLNNSFRVKSLPGSVMRINCSRNSSFERDDSSQITAQSVRSEFLSVPGVRLQSTGSSSDGYSAGSSTHDLPGEVSAMGLLGVPGLGPRGTKPVLQLGGMDFDSDHATAEWIQTIDINVIQPTPNISPCGSVRSVSDNSELARLPLPGRGRIASMVSLDSPDLDNRSIGSDSVFMEDSTIDTYSSMSGSVDSGSPSLLASPRPTFTPSPRGYRRKVQSYRLGITPRAPPIAAAAAAAAAAMSPVMNRASVHRPRDQRSRQKQLQRQKKQDIPVPTITRSGPATSSLLLPSLGNHLSASCERLAAHSAMLAEREQSSSQGSSSLVPTGSTEEEPMCAVFTVPSLRRSNSATTPEQKEEASTGWKRADSEQNPTVRRADSATDPQRQSSESSSDSDEASESVSFHLMVPALSIDNPSNDTSRASSPTLSPPNSPNSSPPTGHSPSPLMTTLETPATPSPVPPTSKGKTSKSGRRMLRRQYSQCLPPSPTFLREMSPSPASLPTYMEELDSAFCFPAAPPPSPFRAGYSLFFRQDSGPPSPLLAAHHLNRRDSSPPSPRSEGYHLFRQDSSPTSPHRSARHHHYEDSSSLSSTGARTLHQGDSSTSSPAHSHYPHLQDSSTSSPAHSHYPHRQDSSTSSPAHSHYPHPLDSSTSSPAHSHYPHPLDSSSPSPKPSDQHSKQEDSRPSSPSCSVMETSC